MVERTTTGRAKQTTQIELEYFPEDDAWEFAAWHGEQQLVVGVRSTRDEAYQAVVEYLEGREHG